MQYAGVAAELPADAATPYVAMMTAKNPYSAKMAERPDQRYFLVKPTWIRLVDMSQKPDETFEIGF